MKKVIGITVLSLALTLGSTLAAVGTAGADGNLDPQVYLEEAQKGAQIVPLFNLQGIEKETKAAPQEYRILKPQSVEPSPSQLEETMKSALPGA